MTIIHNMAIIVCEYVSKVQTIWNSPYDKRSCRNLARIYYDYYYWQHQVV